jgi:hypothetical protein
VALLDDAIVKSRALLLNYQEEMHAREVERLLNRLEGFVAEKMPGAPLAAVVELRRELVVMSDAVNRLASPGFTTDSPLHAKALELVHAVKEKLPELSEELRDIEVLHTLDSAAAKGALDGRLETQAWLDWLRNALPTLDALRVNLKVAELGQENASHQIRGRLRLASSDGVTKSETA